MQVTLNTGSLEDYRRFLAIKRLPTYSIQGHVATFPDEYASFVGMSQPVSSPVDYEPSEFLFDYQRDIAELAIRKRKFAGFIDCGLGKQNIAFEFLRHVDRVLPKDQCALLVCPLMVVDQALQERDRFYGDSLPVEYIPANKLKSWMKDGGRLGITNYDALRDDVPQGRLGALILDESSMLKSHYGKHGQKCIELGKGLEWKLCLTGTPAPNDRIEYGNHAVFLDHFPTINSFLAKYFVNRGQTNERWEIKPHALGPFYRALSHWCIFLTNPAVYGWKDNCESIPPIHTHIHNVDLTPEQEQAVQAHTGGLFASRIGGITSRAKLGRIAKGTHNGGAINTNKPEYIRKLVESWPDESTIIWCLYNDEQAMMEKIFPDAASIDGSTKHERRIELINDFKAGRRKVLISKAKVLGFGLNLQIATRHVFSGLADSYESYYQCVKRSNRYGSTKPLNVHIPVTDVEVPMIETVLRKAKRVQLDTETQENEFKANSLGVRNR
jgi:superfamily II DNA or RNA helicase